MNSFLTKFHMPASNISLVVTIKLHHKKAYSFHEVTILLLLLCILQNNP
jgi:hypothetical protein